MKELDLDLDHITMIDDNGNKKTYDVDTQFELNGHFYVIYTAGEEILMRRIGYMDNEPFLIPITDEEMASVQQAYEDGINRNT